MGVHCNLHCGVATYKSYWSWNVSRSTVRSDSFQNTCKADLTNMQWACVFWMQTPCESPLASCTAVRLEVYLPHLSQGHPSRTTLCLLSPLLPSHHSQQLRTRTSTRSPNCQAMSTSIRHYNHGIWTLHLYAPVKPQLCTSTTAEPPLYLTLPQAASAWGKRAWNHQAFVCLQNLNCDSCSRASLH